MLDILNFAFRDGWHFAGCTLWLTLICAAAARLVRWTPISVRHLVLKGDLEAIADGHAKLFAER